MISKSILLAVTENIKSMDQEVLKKRLEDAESSKLAQTVNSIKRKLICQEVEEKT